MSLQSDVINSVLLSLRKRELNNVADVVDEESFLSSIECDVDFWL